jgi:hypothetical protein
MAGGGYEFLTLFGAVLFTTALVYAIRDPDRSRASLDDIGAAVPKLTTLTAGRHPKLFALTQQIADTFVTERVSRIVTIVEGIESDTLVCVPGAVRVSDTTDDSIVILPERAVFDASPKPPGVMHGEVVFSPSNSHATTVLRNTLLEAAMVERNAIIKHASARLLTTQDPLAHLRLHELHAQLDRVLVAALKRISLACAVQKKRLGLQFEYKYNGIYGSEFTAQAL